MKSVLIRSSAAAVAVGSVSVLVVQVAAVLDLYAFEWDPLFELLGWRGLAAILVLNTGLLMLLIRAILLLRGHRPARRLLSNAVIAAGTLVFLWAVDWVFLETPLTFRAAQLLRGNDATMLSGKEAQDFKDFSVARQARDSESLESLKVAYARIVVDNPDAFARHPIGSTIDRYAGQYGVDPLLLFTTAYLVSFYGEATSGPVPFLHVMTGETIRDVVQVHLPGWFVENALRRALISSRFFERLFGTSAGFKLRYAIHKATLDVSTQPYDASTYSVTFLVMREYPEEFSDVLNRQDAGPLQSALRDSFLKLRETAVVPPYEEPYGRSAYGRAYYREQRKQLKQFARASFYLTALDFDFATRVETLLLRYRRDYYRMRLGPDVWTRMPRWQQNAMLAMVQDVYTPNVGQLAYNLYALPEMVCTGLAFVASAAAEDVGSFRPDQSRLWRPKNYELLWASAGYQLTVMNEIWSLVNADPIPGIRSANSLQDAGNVVSLARRAQSQ